MTTAETQPVNNKRPVMRRRVRYSASLLKGDYFIVRAVQRFAVGWIDALVKPGTVVADVGCGSQPLRGEVESRGGEYVSFDIAQNETGTVDHLCPITDMPCEDGRFDVVLCNEVLHHVSDTYGAFGELARITKPGGRIVITTPFNYHLHEIPYDFVRITPYQFEACAQRSGLVVEALEKAGNEVEVLATVWENLWGFGPLRFGNPVCGVLRVGLRLFGNLCALIANAVFGRALARIAYLNTMVLLRKPGSGEAASGE